MKRYLLAALFLSAPALAAEPEAAPAPAAQQALPATVHLSAEQIAALEADADRKQAQGKDGERKRLDVHGELGFEIGTGGTRSVFGTTMVPLGDNGFAAISFESGRLPDYYRGRRRR